MNDELERLFTMYDGGHLNRRQLIQGLLGLGLGSGVTSTRSDLSASGRLLTPLFRAQSINHVTIRTADLPRSKAFYQSVTGLAERAEDNESCEFRLEHGFLGVYALEAGQRAGYDHFCFDQGVRVLGPQDGSTFKGSFRSRGQSPCPQDGSRTLTP